VFRLRQDLAIIQTVDFFAPIVDDPFTFGQVAATNSLSDIYAMGGQPITVMNLVCFPVKVMSLKVLNHVLQGGLDITKEAGAVLVGGHSVEDSELKYGLAVTGVVHPEKVITNDGAKAGDLLILSKPLGTGIIATALKKGIASEASTQAMLKSMCTLNKNASSAMQEVGVHACTDVTGFGLLGHAMEVAEGSKVGMEIFSEKVPLMENVLDYAEQKLAPGGAEANKKFYENKIEKAQTLKETLYTALHDPQTSGGLLIAVSEEKADHLLSSMKKQGVHSVTVIGRCIAPPVKIKVI